MASSSGCLSALPLTHTSTPMAARGRLLSLVHQRRRRQCHIVFMAPDEEKITRRSPLDFPIEWERPKPGRRPDIFPQFSPMKTPLPPPFPEDPPEEDDEEEEEKKEEEEEDPNKEEPEKPDKESRMHRRGVIFSRTPLPLPLPEDPSEENEEEEEDPNKEEPETPEKQSRMRKRGG